MFVTYQNLKIKFIIIVHKYIVRQISKSALFIMRLTLITFYMLKDNIKNLGAFLGVLPFLDGFNVWLRIVIEMVYIVRQI